MLVRSESVAPYVFLLVPIAILVIASGGLFISWMLWKQPSRISLGNPASGAARAGPALFEIRLGRAIPRKPFDPAELGDPIAMTTDWTPTSSGGANFGTRRLVEIDPDRLEFRASIASRLFAGCFLVTGIATWVLFVGSRLSVGTLPFSPSALMPLLGGLVFAIAGGALLYSGTTPIVFDKQKGFFWKGRKAPDEVAVRYALANATELREIHALQLIAGSYASSDPRYRRHELNLVLKSGERLHVVVLPNVIDLRREASILAGFLRTPVWDAL
jgi:hypothetical protein